MSIHIFLLTSLFAVSTLFATDLGSGGNKRAQDRFLKYKSSREMGSVQGCSEYGNSERRVLLTGFGPFASSRGNISGLVVDSMSDSDFWDSRLSIDDAKYVPGGMYGSDNPGRLGGRAKQRTIFYNGYEYEICFVILEVQWDLAGAISLYEASKFRPNLVLMTGYGADRTQGRLEDVALNIAKGPAGYDSYGRSSGASNYAKGDKILAGGLGSLDMTWLPYDLINRAGEAVDILNELTGKNYGLTKVSGPSPNNTYICNNLSYIMLSGLSNNELKLAGGKIHFDGEDNFSKMPIGFFHFPSGTVNTGDSIWGWGHVLMNMIEGNYLFF